MNRAAASFDTERFRETVYELTRMIPRGQVATYSQIATYALSPRHARAVGNALKNLPRERQAEVPWQRVINASGRISYRGETVRPMRQEKLLEREGVGFDEAGRIDLSKHRWAGPPKDWTPPFRDPEPRVSPPGRTRSRRRRSRAGGDGVLRSSASSRHEDIP